MIRASLTVDGERIFRENLGRFQRAVARHVASALNYAPPTDFGTLPHSIVEPEAIFVPLEFIKKGDLNPPAAIISVHAGPRQGRDPEHVSKQVALDLSKGPWVRTPFTTEAWVEVIFDDGTRACARMREPEPAIAAA